MGLTVRPATRADAEAICEIYNQGIEDRIATFETAPRAPADILDWFDHAHAFVSVADVAGEVVGYAVAHPYSDRCCYRGIGEFSVYVRRTERGRGVGQIAMTALIEDGLWKLVSRIFPENRASLALMGPDGLQGDRRARKARQARWRLEGLRDRRAPDPGKYRLGTALFRHPRLRPARSPE